MLDHAAHPIPHSPDPQTLLDKCFKLTAPADGIVVLTPRAGFSEHPEAAAVVRDLSNGRRVVVDLSELPGLPKEVAGALFVIRNSDPDRLVRVTGVDEAQARVLERLCGGRERVHDIVAIFPSLDEAVQSLGIEAALPAAPETLEVITRQLRSAFLERERVEVARRLLYAAPVEPADPFAVASAGEIDIVRLNTSIPDGTEAARSLGRTLRECSRGVLIIDLNQLTGVGEETIGALLGARGAQLAAGRSELALANVSPEVMNKLRLMKLDRLFAIYPSPAEAAERLAAA